MKKSAYSYVTATGIVVSIILGIVSLIFASVLLGILRAWSFWNFIYIFVSVVVAVNAASHLVARRGISKVAKRAQLFVEHVEELARAIACDRVELLEITPPPFAAVMKSSKRYIVVKYYSYFAEVSILDPIETRVERGYAPIFLKKRSELLTCREKDSIRVCVYRTFAALPEPLEDYIVEGRFYLYAFRLHGLKLDVLIETTSSILRGLPQ